MIAPLLSLPFALDGAGVGILGAFHALELYFVFQQESFQNYDFNAAEIALSQEMLGYWTRFAASGDVNDPSAPDWPSYVATPDTTMILDTPVTTQDAINSARFDELDSSRR